jgi:hypothetical protein
MRDPNEASKYEPPVTSTFVPTSAAARPPRSLESVPAADQALIAGSKSPFMLAYPDRPRIFPLGSATNVGPADDTVLTAVHVPAVGS